MSRRVYIGILLMLSASLWGQFSPGKLSQAHAEYEGLDNCTLCHEIGAQVSEQKCLECHKEMQSLIDRQRGYHASKEVQEKSCINCHSEHHGRNFDAVRFDQENFDHLLTGYELEGGHGRIDCRDCHKPDYISDPEIARRKETFIGLEEDCLSCHDDRHQGTLNQDCLQCHNFEDFEQTPGFDHQKTDFPLRGQHREVECIDCHPIEQRAGKEFQVFADIPFASCVECHEDIHQGKFGKSCTDCHNENSWLKLKLGNRFNHDLTDYPLVGMHQTVDCKECHQGDNYRKALDFARCTDCHEDYHRGEIVAITEGLKDCDACHSLAQPFDYSNYDWEDHQQSDYPLEGAHLATPCFACHKASEDSRWDFAIEDQRCVSCHEDIHAEQISARFYPEQNCEACHNVERWSAISFMHDSTGYALEGQHAQTNCRACHFEDEEQHFKDLDQQCVQCHDNVHGAQFEQEGQTDCLQCHRSSVAWQADLFDHQATDFPLEGKHAVIECSACHKAAAETEIIIYKIEKFACIDCHGS